VKYPGYAKVERSVRDKDGKIDFDVPGCLVGNWFLEGLVVHASMRGTPSVWEKQLAFVYDVRQANAIRISIGGAIAPAGAYRVAAGAPDPATVSPAAGKVRYEIVADTVSTAARAPGGAHAPSRADARGRSDQSGVLSRPCGKRG
jgi:hypothetical protein